MVSDYTQPIPPYTHRGSHGFGGIWELDTKQIFHHNLLANHASRNPRFAWSTTKWVDYRNNVVYNRDSKPLYGGGHRRNKHREQLYKPGPASQHHHTCLRADDGTGRYYVAVT